MSQNRRVQENVTLQLKRYKKLNKFLNKKNNKIQKQTDKTCEIKYSEIKGNTFYDQRFAVPFIRAVCAIFKLITPNH